MHPAPPRAARQRGAVSVELGLAIPTVVILVLGGLHLGRALHARHRLADAAGFAARAAAIAGTGDLNTIRSLVSARMQGESACRQLTVEARRVPQRLGGGSLDHLEVDARCTLATPFGGALLLGMGPKAVSATAAMPYGN